MTWAAIWEFLKRVPGWVWLAIAFIFVGKLYLEGEKGRARKEVNDKRDREAAEAEALIVKTIQENSDAFVRESDAVRSHDAASVLPDGSATLAPYNYRD